MEFFEKETDLDFSNPIYRKIADTFFNEREFEIAKTLYLKLAELEKVGHPAKLNVTLDTN